VAQIRIKTMYVKKLMQGTRHNSGPTPRGLSNIIIGSVSDAGNRRLTDPGLSLAKQSGFTMAELLITVIIAVILMSVAAPSMLNSIRNNRFTALANDFVTSLQLARSEAIKRNQIVNVQALAATDADEWGGGWRVWTDLNGNGSFDANEQLSIKQPDRSFIFMNSTEGTGDTTVSDLVDIAYRPSGILATALKADTTTIELRPDPQVQDFRGDVRNIIINRAGSVRVERLPYTE
jgi:type IV fimbrial biogenesis protein FimT